MIVHGLPKLALASNVRHPYDYCFEPSADWIFLRMYSSEKSRGADVPRRQMFAQMERAGIETVPNGLVSEIINKYDCPWGVVVYTNERAHRGAGKLWLTAREASENYSTFWCSVFYPPAGRCIRHFQFGDRSFTMPFQSTTDWRCQRGEGSYSYCIPGSRWSNLFPNVIPFPYFAIDFIPGTDMATDFQFVPGIENDGLDNWMKPREMYRSLQRATSILLEKGSLPCGGIDAGFGIVSKDQFDKESDFFERFGEHELTNW